MPIRIFAVVGAFALAGCASEVARVAEPLVPVRTGEEHRISLSTAAAIKLPSGYDRMLPSGSVWEKRGTIAQGIAYRRADGVFTIEGAHVHEAYIVLSGTQLVGFYLPVERAYSPAEPIILKLK